MNYRHLFHAGNFADVFKHALLMQLVRALQRKDTPIFFLDTHAGAGRYDLASPEAQRSGEYRDGIGRLWDQTGAESAELADYLDCVRAFNRDRRLRCYPGSPAIVGRLLRARDRMSLCELRPDEYARLKQDFSGNSQASVHERDGYEALKGLLPPAERRGLVLIDPPYEQRDEFKRLISGLEIAHRRWASGVYALWYPIKDRSVVSRLHERIGKGAWSKALVAELLVFPEDTAFRLNGCGMLLLNPPWEFDRMLERLLQDLAKRLSRELPASGTVRWLVEDRG